MLMWIEDASQIKAVNSKVYLVQGIAKGVKVNVRDWSGSLNFTTVPLDKFKIVLRKDFLRNPRVSFMLVANYLLFMGDKPCCMLV